MSDGALPELDPAICLRCGKPAPGTLRVAIWEEEEKGRLGARPVSLCAKCHGEFMAGTLTRTEVGRIDHEKKGVHPRGWIGRLERDLLLDTVCLNCGVILQAIEFEGAVSDAAADTVACPSCGTVNRVRPRGDRRLTAEIVVG